jgi:CRP-like cAMP-binding protein
MELTIGSLKRFFLFSTAPDQNLERLLPLIRVVPYRSGQKIFEEGCQGDRLYLVSAGSVRICKFIEGIGEEVLGVMKPGMYFGEMSIIDSRPRSATAVAHSDCEVWEISRNDILSLLQGDREIAYHILWNLLKTMSQRLRDSNEKIKAFFAMSSGY